MDLPWLPGSATGIGSHPGTSYAEALSLVLGELPLPYLPELPGRGPGADILGRSAGLLVDLPTELYAARWQFTASPGRDARRTAELWDRDLDTLSDLADRYAGPFKLQVAGPWTLAAGLQLPVGGAVLRDAGARRDLFASLTEGIRRHVADVSARVPGAQVILQLDEPSLPAVLAGHISTESGLSVFPAVDDLVAAEVLRDLVAAVGVPVVVHCCAPDVPVAMLRTTGAVGVALDLSLLGNLDPLGEAVDSGFGLFAGVSPVSARAAAAQVRELWNKWGLPAKDLGRQVVVTPTCGLASSSPDGARAALIACREAAKRLAETE